MTTEIYRHGERSHMAGALLDVHRKRSDATTQTLRSNTRGIDHLQNPLLKPGVAHVVMGLPDRTQERLFSKNHGVIR